MRVITNMEGEPLKTGYMLSFEILNGSFSRFNPTTTNRYFEIDTGENITLDIDLTDEMIILHLAHFL